MGAVLDARPDALDDAVAGDGGTGIDPEDSHRRPPRVGVSAARRGESEFEGGAQQ